MSDQFGRISIQQQAAPTPPPAPRRPSKKTRPPSPQKQRREKPQSRGMSLVWFLVLVLLFTLYNVAGFVGVPYYVSTILPKTIYEKTGFIFQARTVNFNPLTFVFSAENSKLMSADETLPDLLKIKSLRGKFKPLSLLRNDLVSDSITIEELEAHITRKADGSYIFASLFESSKKDNQAEMMDFSDLPFQFSLNNIAVSKSKIIFSDLPLKKKHSIEDIQFALPTFSNFPFQAGNYIQPHFSATINGSPLELTGKASVGEKGGEKHTTDLSCDIHSLDLPLYFGYLPFELPFNFSHGKADGKIGLTFSPKGKKGEKLAITFDLKIRETAFSTHNNTIKVRAPEASLVGTLHPVSKNIHLKTLSMRTPVISSFGESFTGNIRNIIKGASKKVAPLGVPAKAAATIDIDLVIIDDGTLQLFNENESTKLHSSWKSIQFSLKDYTSAANSAKEQKRGLFRLTGDQDGAPSTFSWQGELAGSKILDGQLSINNIQTSTLFQSFNVKPLIGSTGLVDLKGRLRLNLEADSPSSPGYRFTESTISIQNFSLLEKKSTILSTPILTLSKFSSSDEQTDFGNISIDNGTLRLTKGQLPKSFSLFSEKKYQVHDINFVGKATLLAGKKDGLKLQFPDVTLKAKDLNLPEKSKNNITISAKGTNGDTLKAAGSVSLIPFKATLKTEFTRLQAKTVFSWFTNLPFLTNMEGFIGGNGNLTLPNTGFVGQLNLDKASFAGEKKSVFSLETGTFQDINFSSKPFHLGIVSAELGSLSFPWKIDANDNSPMENFTNFLKRQFPFLYEKKQAKKNITISSFDVQEVTVKNGQIKVEEQRMSPAWKGSITNLSGKITDIHSAKTSVKSQFQLTGNLDDTPIAIEGESDFFSEKKNGNFSFSLTDFPVAAFHDQLAPLVDIDTSKGTFRLTQNRQWVDSGLDNSGTITFTGIEPESPTSESTLPLALLADNVNTFSLDFSSSEQEPTSKSLLFDDIIGRFNKLIVKSSVSPLLVAAGDFKDLIGNEFVEFKPGEALISRRGRETVGRYGDLLTANPNVGLSITGRYDLNTDTAALKTVLENEESERIAAENKNRFKKWEEQKKAYSTMFEQKREQILQEGKIAEQDLPPKFLQEFIPIQPQRITVTETMLQDLADKRVIAVYQHLITQLSVEPEKITIIDSKQLPATGDSQPKSVSITINPLR